MGEWKYVYLHRFFINPKKWVMLAFYKKNRTRLGWCGENVLKSSKVRIWKGVGWKMACFFIIFFAKCCFFPGRLDEKALHSCCCSVLCFFYAPVFFFVFLSILYDAECSVVFFFNWVLTGVLKRGIIGLTRGRVFYFFLFLKRMQ